MEKTTLLTRRSMLRTVAASEITHGLAPGQSLMAQHATPVASPIARTPLWQTAWERGLIYGTSTSTWQLEDAEYA